MANQTNGNQFREDEIIILEQLRDGKWVKNIFPKIAGGGSTLLTVPSKSRESLLLQRRERSALHHHGDRSV